MYFPKDEHDLGLQIQASGKQVLFFTANWCPDCHFILPVMPEIEAENPEFRFVQVERDDFMDVCQAYSVLGIPSFIVLENGQEVGRFVDRNRKTKAEITAFLKNFK
ncbi:thioredoxin family protein [Streptococcus caprae]|uniref:Thioredoxin family protein n=1 Tax=Streptococcus caprae TaxID=1640501 RepID=A0ABV8CWZ4_9STRE